MPNVCLKKVCKKSLVHLKHSKWLNKTFGDIGVNNPDCQTVCEIHVDPEFLKIVRARSGYKHIQLTSPDPSPGPMTRKRGLPKTRANSGIKLYKRNPKQLSKDNSGPDSHEQVDKEFEFVSIPKDSDVTDDDEDMPEPDKEVQTVSVSNKVSKRRSIKTKVNIANDNMVTPKTLKVVPRPKDVKTYKVSKKPAADSTNTKVQQPSDVITTEVMIKDDPDPIEAVVLPYIPDDFKIKVETSDPEGNMNSDVHNQSFVVSEPLTCQDNDFNVATCSTSEVKIEHRTDYLQYVKDLEIEIKAENISEDLEDHIDEDSKIDPILLKQVKEQAADNPEPLKDFHSTFDELLQDLVNRKFISTNDKNVLAVHKLDISILKEIVPLHSYLHTKLLGFAISLYVYSNEGYEYIRSIYKTLPDKTILREWLVKPPGQLGFSRDTLVAIHTKAKQTKPLPIFVCIHIKEIKLAQSRAYQGPKRGVISLDWSIAQSTSALVFTAIGINANWKLPIAHFWTDIIRNRATFVQAAIAILEKVGVVPVAVSFDYNDENLRMCTQLGGMSANGHLLPIFLTEKGREMLLFPDPRKILEVMFRDVENINNIVDEDHEAVFLNQKLLQNKFPDTTPQQLLRKTIATELFKNDCSDIATQSTIKFFRHLHMVLDVFAFRVDGSHFKKIYHSHSINNLSVVTLIAIRKYFKSLQIKDLSMRNCILGLCALIDSSLLFISQLSNLRFQFGKFFGSSYFLANLTPLGQNRRNPTPLNFQKEYKAILLDASLYCPKKNIPLLKCKSPVDIINITTYLSNGNSILHVVDDLKIIFGYKYTEYEDMIVVYVARFVTYSLSRRLQCELCIRALRSNLIAKPKTVSRFAVKIEEPSLEVLIICKKAEAIFKNACNSQRNVIPQFSVPGLVIKVMKEYVNRPLFEGILHHQYDTDGTCNHIVVLVKAVAELYLETRIQYYKSK